jgi:hypothetical protein
MREISIVMVIIDDGKDVNDSEGLIDQQKLFHQVLLCLRI